MKVRDHGRPTLGPIVQTVNYQGCPGSLFIASVNIFFSISIYPTLLALHESKILIDFKVLSLPASFKTHLCIVITWTIGGVLWVRARVLVSGTQR